MVLGWNRASSVSLPPPATAGAASANAAHIPNPNMIFFMQAHWHRRKINLPSDCDATSGRVDKTSTIPRLSRELSVERMGGMLSRRDMMVNATAALLAAPASAATAKSGTLHRRLVCLDTHLDTPASLARPGWNMMQRHSRDADFTQVDYPRMVKGGL